MKIKSATLLACCMLGCWQYTYAAQLSGYVIEWGWNTSSGIAAPARQVLGDAISVSVGSLHCLALKSDGTVVQWSGNFRGEASFANTVLTTGEGGFTDKTGFHITYTNTTTIVTNGVVKCDGKILKDTVSIAAGDGFSLALKKNGTIVTWGENYVPAGLTNIMAIAAAGFTSLALKADGTVVEWESKKWLPQYGQLLEVPIGSNVVAVAIGEAYQGTRNIALKKNGRVARWGSKYDNNYDTPPAGLSNVVAIAAGGGHTLALKSDGTVVGWGFNNVGQATGIPTTNSPNISAGQVTIDGKVLSNVASIAAGQGYSMALKKDGTVVAWGRMVNDLYPATVPAGLSNVVAIATGDNFCLAITTNRSVADKFR